MATHTDEHVERALDAFASRPVRRSLPVRRDVFVTGTDTGVGKTVATAAIVARLMAEGLRVAMFKPLQTGTIDGDDDARDVAALTACDTFTGVAFTDPLAPSVAARIADTEIDVASLIAQLEDLQRSYEAVVVEGAGGLLVPIDDATTMGDLARSMRLPIVVVARPALGTLNHTALTVDAARARGLVIEGIVISGMPPDPNLAESTNLREIERLTGVKVTAVIPALDRIDRDAFSASDAWFDRSVFLGQSAAT